MRVSSSCHSRETKRRRCGPFTTSTCVISERRMPWPFNATLTNGVPPGEIDVNGAFGPWQRKEPGDTPLERRLRLREGGSQRLQGHLGHPLVSGLLRRHAGEARGSRRHRHAGFHHRGRRSSVSPLRAVPGAHRRYERRHAPQGHRRLVPELLSARHRRRPRRAEGTERANGLARRRDGQVAHRGRDDDGREEPRLHRWSAG